MNAVNISIGFGAVAAVAGLVLLIRWFIRSVRQQGADEKKAEQDQGELAERIEADKKMHKAGEEAARKGGAKGAFGRGEF